MTLKIETELIHGIMLMQPGGPVTDLTAHSFREELRKAAEASEHGVVCDLANVPFAASSFFGALVAAGKKDKGRLVLAAVHPDLAQTFKLAQLDQILDITSTVDEAMKLIREE